VRIGLLGGTFNPPHIAHLVCAQEAWRQLELDSVWFVPVRQPPHKEADGDPGAAVRVHLCRLAVAGDPRLAVSTIEADHPGRSYTVDTLTRLHEHHPEHDLTFILGGDQASALPSWRDPAGVLEHAVIGVAARGDLGRAEVLEAVRGLPGAAGRLRFFDMPRLDISSSTIRARAAAGQPIRYLVPDAVATEIARAGLYAKAARR
jgi:nicotinate-nucleotide adenylyltransferase